MFLVSLGIRVPSTEADDGLSWAASRASQSPIMIFFGAAFGRLALNLLSNLQQKAPQKGFSTLEETHQSPHLYQVYPC